jgi:hypothetical protein
MKAERIIASVKKWVDTVVIGLELCPFARRERECKSIRFTVKEATTQEALLFDLHSEIEILKGAPDIETTLMIHPCVLEDFKEFNDFLSLADSWIDAQGLTGEFQIASFHPEYGFSDTEPEDVVNYTNRSPYPILHILREESLERAIAGYQGIEAVPERNCQLLRELGSERMKALLRACLE